MSGELDIYDIMHAPESFGKFELDSKLIVVAKKQDDNLRRLIDLFKKNKDMSSKRTLIIDDEADDASIGHTKKSRLIEANKIAHQISDLRSAIQNSSYLQVTATPYSLYLQPSESEVANVIAFQPTRPAFTKLVPVSPEYVGGETYFGDSSKSEADTLESLIHPTVDHREFERLKKPDGRSFKPDDVLTTPAIKGFRAAIVNFIIQLVQSASPDFSFFLLLLKSLAVRARLFFAVENVQWPPAVVTFVVENHDRHPVVKLHLGFTTDLLIDQLSNVRVVADNNHQRRNMLLAGGGALDVLKALLPLASQLPESALSLAVKTVGFGLRAYESTRFCQQSISGLSGGSSRIFRQRPSRLHGGWARPGC